MRRQPSLLLLCAALLLVHGPSTSLTFAQSASEFQVKAAFVLNFLRLSEFPETDLDRSGYSICILASDSAIEGFKLMNGKLVNGKPVTILSLGEQNQTNCDALYIAPNHLEQGRTALRRFAKNSTLTIGEAPDLLSDGLVVRFFLEEGKVKFEINVNAVNEKKLKLSSKLLSLARIVGQD
ncbi:MAG: YfiR family protein [Oligoflexia bacterium]|nr:YfiR family protein [Oligoflexia bacterium]